MSGTAAVITAIGGALAAGTGAYTAASAPAKSRKQQKRQIELMGIQNKYAQENADIAYQRQMALYERAYQDESYANRVKQMKEAGLNVGLMYGGGAGGGGGSGTIGNVQGAGAPSGGQAPSGAAEAQIQQQGAKMALDSAQQVANIKLTEAQAQNVTEDTNLKKEQTGETTSAKELNIANAEWVNSKSEGQKLQNKFDEIRNEIGAATKTWQMEKIQYEADVWFEESEIAYERKLQAVEGTERAQQTTGEFIQQTGLATQTMVVELIQAKAKVELTKAQKEEIYGMLSLTAEGNDIKWDQNRISESLGTMGIDQADRKSLMGVIGGIMNAGLSLWGTAKIARAMGGSVKAAGRGAGTKAVVGAYNSSTGTVSWGE